MAEVALIITTTTALIRTIPIITALCTNVWNRISKRLEEYQKEHQERKRNGPSHLETIVREGGREIGDRWDGYVRRLGDAFSNGDSMVQPVRTRVVES